MTRSTPARSVVAEPLTKWCVALTASALIATNACSGDTTTSGPFRESGAGVGGASQGTGGASPAMGGTGTQAPQAICGDGRLDPGEMCDGSDLAGNTCATATMGGLAAGELRCTTSCAFDVSGCSTSGAGGSGTGGASGTGGGAGSSGM